MPSCRRRLVPLLATSALLLAPLVATTASVAPQASVAAPVAGSVSDLHTDVDGIELVEGSRYAARHRAGRHKARHHQARSATRRGRVARATGPGWLPMAPGVRWNPCTTINYKVNLAGAPADALAVVNQAFGAIHAAGGLSFAFAGTTTKTPFTAANEGEDNTIIVAWSSPDQVSGLSGSRVGVGGSTWRPTRGGGGVYVRGGVALRRGAPISLGFGPGASEGSLLLHEIGHAIGLNHVGRKGEVMYPALGPWSRAAYGAGDTAGLRALGSAAGCTS